MKCNMAVVREKIRKCLDKQGRNLVQNNKCECFSCKDKELCIVGHILKNNFKKGEKNV